MSDLPEETRVEMALREGLRGLPAPTVSPEFNARVHAALRRPVPWWQSLWASARPVLCAGACSLVGMLALLSWVIRAPLPASPHPAFSAPAASAMDLDRAMERLDRAGVSLHDLSSLRLLSKLNVPETTAPPEGLQNPIRNHHSLLSPEEKQPWKHENAIASGWWGPLSES
ncbi:MAG TPA: hypothetical protein VFA07_12160 [Chthonomonadaceae bacterium]|nr:hypothetical protein [Chthonomonadaceae bacterium]